MYVGMDYSKINLFSLMQTKMSYLSERQDVLARNVANIDTPGYKPKDLKKLDFEKLAMIEANRLQLKATSPAHITHPRGKPEDYRSETMRETYERIPVENEVVLEEQMMMVAETHMDYQKVTNLYGKVSSMFKTAIGNR